MVVDDDVAREVHHRDHHSEARDRGQHRGKNTWAAHDLPRAAARRRRFVPARGDALPDQLGIGPHPRLTAQATSDKQAAASMGP